MAKPPRVNSDWDTLLILIANYTEAAITDSWKGGADPAGWAQTVAEMELAQARMLAHIETMKRTLT